ncbi:MAG: DNA-directed RNA polymerase subunit E'' [Nanoarchaeota archaeon]|nr:DNA-directed RNA polymerase subunit E'' [Nanoarchaeota archaeon]MBU1321577.1 DNA-directed RNA polymerase subunit E'' [Nanoarchaeota archaeon]MBU1598378.1 DNA-directed RNA polymerase subunit E'' [Nanoarchaeota archaeon]MBU2442133.1 DNA-directed RNA polymerase subunit E'' [Nanoarchaeota archaeon]
MKKQVCRTCKAFFVADSCPVCKKKSAATVWQGRIHFLSIKKSEIAKKMNIERDGEYAIKVR